MAVGQIFVTIAITMTTATIVIADMLHIVPPPGGPSAFVIVRTSVSGTLS
jgi:hypothetical protein